MPDDLLTKITTGKLANGDVELDQKKLQKIAEFDPTRLDAYKLYGEYYRGEQQTLLPDRLKQFLERQGIQWSENFVETVVDTLAARLAVNGFTTSLLAKDKENKEDDSLADWLQAYVWEKNRLDAKQQQIHNAGIRLGDAFVMVDWDAAKGCPRVTYNRPDMINADWDDDGNFKWVAKKWETEADSPTNPTQKTIVRMNVYYPDRVEKYFRLSSSGDEKWSLHLDEDDTTWPTPWQQDGKPIGIPVFHFASRADDNHWGRSEVAGILPQQNLLNKQILDLALIMDSLGYPQRYGVGIDSSSELKTAPGEVWTTPVAGASFGQFEAAPLDGPLNAIEKTLLRMSARSSTPAHLLVMTAGGAPSGESLKSSEAGLVKKATNLSIGWGDVWTDIMLMATRLGFIFGEQAKQPPVADADWIDLTINTTWTDIESRNEKEHLEALALMKELGVSKRTILTKIPGIDADQELEQAEMDQEAAGAEMMAFIDRGGQPGPGKPPRPGQPPTNGAPTQEGAPVQ